MTKTLELGKAEFITVEFYLDEDQDERYDDGGCDFYYVEQLHDNETIEEAIVAILGEIDEKVYVNVSPRRYATLEVDDDGDIGEVIDYGDSCLGGEDYIYENNVLLTEYDHQLVYG